MGVKAVPFPFYTSLLLNVYSIYPPAQNRTKWNRFNLLLQNMHGYNRPLVIIHLVHFVLMYTTYFMTNILHHTMCVQDMNKYSQSSLTATMFCSFSLKWIAVINTLNSLSASNPCYCDSPFNKISYPDVPSLVHSHPPSSTTEEQWFSLPSPSSPTSSSSLQTVTIVTISGSTQCLRIT